MESFNSEQPNNKDTENLSASVIIQTNQASQPNEQEEVIYNCAFNGTCSSIEDMVSPYYPYGEAIADMRHRMVGYVLGLDGPGSKAKPLAQYNETAQIALGWGIDLNLKISLDDIRKQYRIAKEQGKKFKVNLCGWSRGAAAAISLASLMYKDPELKEIAVNLFAIDPVPGRVPGKTNADVDNLTLHENVKDAIIVYAKNERSYGFEPVIPTPTHPKITNLQYVVMPGHHATLPGNPFWRNSVNANFRVEEPGKIVRWMLETFLKGHGTVLKDSPYRKHERVTKGMLLKLFEQIAKDEKIYEGFQSGKDLYTAQKYGRREAYYGPESVTGLYQKLCYLDDAFASEYKRKPFVNYLHEYLATKLEHVADDAEVDLQEFILSEKKAREAEINKLANSFTELDKSTELNNSVEMPLSNSILAPLPSIELHNDVEAEQANINTSQIMMSVATRKSQTLEEKDELIKNMENFLSLMNERIKKLVEMNIDLIAGNDELMKQIDLLKIELEQLRSKEPPKSPVDNSENERKIKYLEEQLVEIKKELEQARNKEPKIVYVKQEVSPEQIEEERKKLKQESERILQEKSKETEDRLKKEFEEKIRKAKEELQNKAPVIPDTQKFEREIQKLERANKDLKEKLENLERSSKTDKELAVKGLNDEMLILKDKIAKLIEEHKIELNRREEDYKRTRDRDIENAKQVTSAQVEKETTEKFNYQIKTLQQELQEMKVQLDKLNKENQELKNRPPVQVGVGKDTISLAEHNRIVKERDDAAQRAQVQHEQTVSQMKEAAQQKQVRFDLEKQRINQEALEKAKKEIEQEALKKAEKEIEQRNFKRIVDEVMAEMKKSTLTGKPELHQEFKDYQTNLEHLEKIKPEDPLYEALYPIYVKMVYLQHGLLKETNKKSDPETDRINTIILQHFKTIPLEILNQEIPKDQKLSPKLAHKLNVPKKSSSNGEDPKEQPTFTQAEKMLKDRFSELNNELAKSPPISTRTKALMFGVLGAIIGFVVGAVIGGVASFYMGGSLSIPLGILAAVKGFTIGTAIGIGASGVTTLATGGAAAAHGVFATQKFKKEEESKEKVQKDYLKIAPSGGS